MAYYYNYSPYYSENDDYHDGLYETDSPDEYGDLIAGLSNMSLQQKKNAIDCKECFPCEHLISCIYPSCSTCTDAVKAGCQNKYCQKHQCRENSLKCDCSTLRLKANYADHRGKEVYGWFKCSKKQGKGKNQGKPVFCNKWNSAHAWIQRGEFLTQDCKKCETPRVPYKARLKEWRGNTATDDSKQPHDQARCEMCQRKRRPCWYDE